MKIIQGLIQGSEAWLAHRATCWNASDTPAMLGISPYKSRADLVRERATGITPEVDWATQARFNDGHRAEVLARPLAEEIIGEELFPVTGTSDCGKYSASFDGLTVLEDAAFEHKTLNNDLLGVADLAGGVLDGDLLPEHYRAQMEQQCIVSGASRVLFMASKWDGETLVAERHGWYKPDPELRARIIAGWEQFERDVAAYVPEPAPAHVAVGKTPETLPYLRVEAKGMVTASNLDEFRSHAMAVLGSINRGLKTDEDFADAESTVKWCLVVEDRLQDTKANVLAQMESVDSVCRTIDEISEETRKIRLELDRLVKAEKESRKAELVTTGMEQVREHFAGINASLGEYAIQPRQSLHMDIGAAIKGLKTLSSMRDKIDSAVANIKIEASQKADKVRACMTVIAEFDAHAHLIADRVQLCLSKSPDDLRNLIMARIAEHKAREDARLEAEREKIRQQELARIERERAEAEQAEQPKKEPVAQSVEHLPSKQAVVGSIPTGLSITIGEINLAIAPLSIDSRGLESLGFRAKQDGARKVYSACDWPSIRAAICNHLVAAEIEQLKETA